MSDTDPASRHSEAETQSRFVKALKAALDTPPLPREDVPLHRAESKRGKKKPAKASP